MDLLPKYLFRLLSPIRRRHKLLQWHLANCERNTGLFSTALPLITVTSFFVGIGVLIIDKQREMAFYRIQSVGLREHQLNEEREQLIHFLNQSTVPSDELDMKPVAR